MPFGAALVAAGTIYAADKTNDTAKEAGKNQAGQNAAEREFILQQTGQARDDVNRIYGMQADNSMMGGQAALDILRGALPQQAGFFNQGQNNAMAAILGGELTPFAQPDYSFIQQTVPQYKKFQQVAPSSVGSLLSGSVPSLPATTSAGKNALGKYTTLGGRRIK